MRDGRRDEQFCSLKLLNTSRPVRRDSFFSTVSAIWNVVGILFLLYDPLQPVTSQYLAYLKIGREKKIY